MNLTKNGFQEKNLIAAFPGKYIQGEDALFQLPKYIELLGNSALIIASPTVINDVLPIFDFSDAGGSISVEKFNGECSENELKRLSEIVKNGNIDVIVAMGGGKTIDASKIVADRANLPVIIAPTIASNDAPCSGCAVIYTEQGEFESVHYMRLNPQIVLVDTKVIANAPSRFLIAGMGDALSTWFEARACERSQSGNECGGYSTMTGLNLAKLCYDTLLDYGIPALIACQNKVVTPALNRIIEANTLLSGIGFESSGLATAHSVHNGLSALEETRSYYHGEKVAFGVLTGLHLTDADPNEIDEVYSFCETVGLPTTFEEIGILDTNKDRLLKVGEKTCSPLESIHHEAIKVNPQKIVDAMIMADAMGKARKNI